VKPELKYGLLAGAAMIAWTLLEYAAGVHHTRLALGNYTAWGPEVILLLMLWRLLRLKFATLNRYWLPAWEAGWYGATASLVAGLVFYIFLNVYVARINPEWPDLHLEWRVAQMRAGGESEQTIRLFVRNFRWSLGPVGLAVFTVGLFTLLGGTVSAILSLWLNLRHKEPPDVG